jgi:hypothetical protein
MAHTSMTTIANMLKLTDSLVPLKLRVRSGDETNLLTTVVSTLIL